MTVIFQETLIPSTAPMFYVKFSNSISAVQNRCGVLFCFFLDSIVLEIETLSDFAYMKMHKKCSYLINSAC